MREFEYAAPRTEGEAVSLLSPRDGATEILAGGTDLMGLMKRMIVTPERVVNIKEIRSMRGIEARSEEVVIGAATPLGDVLDSPLVDEFPAVGQAIRGISSLQLQSQSTLGGELCHRPACWYFRGGHGLLAESGRRVVEGDGRFHAIFGNTGPAKFVAASRLAPALVALSARLRVVGPNPEDEEELSLAEFYRTPRHESQREHVLTPDQLITHVIIPRQALASATYEVRHGAGPDAPLVSAAAALEIEAGLVRQASIVLGQVAPTPWVSADAALAITGQPIDDVTADFAGEQAIRSATPLKDNRYKVQLIKVAVTRAILLAAGKDPGGL